jgi:hypothetical protein
MYGQGEGVYMILVEDLREGDHLEDPGVDGRTILKCIFTKWDWGMDWINPLKTKRISFM